MRRYDEPIQVLVAEQPVQFLWRNRLLLVKRIVTRWVETNQWWRTLEGGGSLLEQEVWRVEAGNGQRLGVYEIVRLSDAQWCLRSVLD